MTEAYAPFSDSAIALIPSALSGGSLQQRLQEAVERFGAARVALAVERVAEDFFLPSPPARGCPSPGRSCASGWRNGLRRCSSPASCAPTTLPTCPGRTGPTSSLFDDAGSIRKKLQVARNLGISSAVLAYPQVDDLLPELLK